jgi:hypothetical protein
MRIWNLSKFSDLEVEVMVRNTSAETQPSHAPAQVSYRSQSIKLAIRVAALAVATIPLSMPVGTSDVLSVPKSAVVHNADDRPPLAAMFDKRYGESWTKQTENKLLAKIAASRGDVGSDELLNIVHSSQQEQLAGVPRLDENEVFRIVRRKA